MRRDAKDSRQHGINLNPDHFVGETDEKIVSTLAHEMTHLWQHVCVKPIKSGYHDAKWAAKMKEIGLYPSSTGKPGGKETGHRTSHYIVTGGRFSEVFAALAKTGWRLDLECAGARGKPDGKTPFTCPACGAKAWGKPDLQIACIPCGARMLPPATAAEPRRMAVVDGQAGRAM